MKDLMKKMMEKKGPADPPPGDQVDMHSQAKLKVLGHLRKMASGMMGEDVKKGYAKGGVVGEKLDYKLPPKQENDGSSESEGIDDHDDDTEASVAELNSMDNEQDSQDFNEEHTPESLQAEIDRLHEMKRRVVERKL